MAGYDWVGGVQMVNFMCLNKKCVCVCVCVCVCDVVSHQVPVSGCHAVVKACIHGTSTVPFFLCL